MDYRSFLWIIIWSQVVTSVIGCKYNGELYKDGSEWLSKIDPCKVSSCLAGVITHSNLQCRPGCREQIYKSGHCCPACISTVKKNSKTCLLDAGVEVDNGKTIIKPGEECTQCKCQAGELMCTVKVCPVLNCKEKHQIKEKGQCCPVCTDHKEKTLKPADGKCIFRGHYHQKDKHFMPDKCTNCVCKDGSMQCYRKTCPVLDCPEEFLVHDKKSCCPKCHKPKGCEYKGQVFQLGQTWKDDSCTDCKCKDGKVTCQQITCGLTPKCSKKQILYRPPGECCPICVSAHSVCSVSNSNKDHLNYASFDGLNYKFGGTCRYTLLQDINERLVNIRLKNEYHPYPNVRTKLVTIITSNIPIGLHRDRLVRVNKTKVELPYKHENFTIDVINNQTVVVNLINGFKLSWSKNGELSIYATPSWHGKLGGLCGNFNQVIKDDLTTKKLELVKDTEMFAQSWRVGGKCSCDEPFNTKQSSCKTADQRVRAHKKCEVLKSSVFKKCHSKVPVKSFMRACTDNVCECPLGENCECSIIKLYTTECEKHNIRIRLPKKSSCSRPQTTGGKKKKNQKKKRGKAPPLMLKK